MTSPPTLDSLLMISPSVSFHSDKKVKRVYVLERSNLIVNRLNKASGFAPRPLCTSLTSFTCSRPKSSEKWTTNQIGSSGSRRRQRCDG